MQSPEAYAPHTTSIDADRPEVPYTRRLLTSWLALKYNLFVLAWIAAALFFWTWWLRPSSMLPGPAYIVASFALFWTYFLFGFFFVIHRRAIVPNGPPPDPNTVRVAMITTKTPSEPFSIVRRTLEAMLAQDYPHDTWLADEDPSAETIAWCEAHGVRISTRKGRDDYHRSEWPRRTRCKEGNLAFFYDTYGYENYDFVSQLDADHVPKPSYLTEIMRGFRDPKVGYVSGPSICSNNEKESWAARTRLYNEAAFHGIFQCGYANGLTPMCIGSHYAVRTKALKEVGGLGPELAEDHSTTMLMAAGHWRGVHAIDAIATGDGPATFADLCIQEFQWSRSLVTLLGKYTPDYLPSLPAKLKWQFLFCQFLYPMIALTMLLLYLLPIVALIGDFRYADVTFGAFVLHNFPSVLICIAVLFAFRKDGFLRPYDAKVLGWEKILFFAIQWPWVLWGCMMATRDLLTGSFVDFRVTPKGENTVAELPFPVFLPYLLLSLGAILPTLLIEDLEFANGFYLLSLLSAVIYMSVLAVAVYHHIVDNHIKLGLRPRLVHLQLLCVLGLVGLFSVAFAERSLISLHALSLGLEPLQIVRIEFAVSGAGMGTGNVQPVFDPGWRMTVEN
ncbi:glycosyltransferase family 2 protein [Aestuariivita boseongensis]|uniref:glycosyltransferase family 2 protein n=1 Tax=Aestuariivita boseongensis TaxID=1470562 RepID=UPI0009E59055|nr:glycosyltransferase family 2 protein [Aestuariivita boseongensis]